MVGGITPRETDRAGFGSAGRARVVHDLGGDVVRRNPDNVRIVGPDETASNRLDAVYEVTDKVWAGRLLDDDHLRS